MEYRHNAIEFGNILTPSVFKFLQLVVAKVSLVAGSFFRQSSSAWFESFASRKLDLKNWKADFKVNALHEGKDATRWGFQTAK